MKLSSAQEKILLRYYPLGYRDSGRVWEFRSMKILVEKGYILRQADPDNPHILSYFITQKGRDYIEALESKGTTTT